MKLLLSRCPQGEGVEGMYLSLGQVDKEKEPVRRKSLPIFPSRETIKEKAESLMGGGKMESTRGRPSCQRLSPLIWGLEGYRCFREVSVCEL